MSTQRVALSADTERFIEEQVSAGHYRNASDVVRAGLRLLERQVRSDQEKLATLRSLAKEAFDDLDAGYGIDARDNEELTELIRRIGIEVATGDPSSSRDR